MSRLERPLLPKTIALTGDIALRAELILRIKTVFDGTPMATAPHGLVVIEKI